MSQVLTAETKRVESGFYRKILVAVDGSENSRKAARTAIWLAKATGAKLIALAVVQLPILLDQGIPGGGSYGIGEYLSQTKKYLEKVVGEIAEEAARVGVNAEHVVLDGAASVVQAIADYAAENNVDLIVVGTRGLGGFKKLVLGSVSSGLVSHAPCAVLVVR
ncbi:MAG: universal stress protein [Thermoprotei archaeon]